HVSIDIDVQVLAFLLQQKLVDAVPKDVLLMVVQGLLQAQSSVALLLQFSGKLPFGTLQVASRNDVAIDFSDDLLNNAYVGGHRHTGNGEENAQKLHLFYCRTACSNNRAKINAIRHEHRPAKHVPFHTGLDRKPLWNAFLDRSGRGWHG